MTDAQMASLLEDLKVLAPEAGLTLGYIGNVEISGDFRAWYLFTTVPIEGLWGTERMKLSFDPAAPLHQIRKDMESWLLRRVLPRVTGGAR